MMLRVIAAFILFCTVFWLGGISKERDIRLYNRALSICAEDLSAAMKKEKLPYYVRYDGEGWVSLTRRPPSLRRAREVAEASVVFIK